MVQQAPFSTLRIPLDYMLDYFTGDLNLVMHHDPRKNPQPNWLVHTFSPTWSHKVSEQNPHICGKSHSTLQFSIKKNLLVTYCREIPVKSKSVAKSQLDPPLLPSPLDDFNECFIPNSWLLNPCLWNQSGHHHFNIHIQRIPNYFMQNNFNVI